MDFERRVGSGAAGDQNTFNFFPIEILSEIIDFERQAGSGAAGDGKANAFNENPLQAVMKNKKVQLSNLLNFMGKADITYLVNFNLLKEYFKKKKLKVENIVTQKFFLEKMGIIERAKILEKNMNNHQKKIMFLTLKRLLHKDLMGELFKVIFAFNTKKNNFLGFN